MVSTTLPIPTNANHASDRDTGDVPSRAEHQPPTLVACFVLPAEQAEQLISILRDMAVKPIADSASPAALISKPQPNSVWMTHVEAAAYLGIAISTLYRYAEQEKIECRKIGNRLEYRRTSLDRFKDQQIRPARRSRTRGIIAPTLGSGN